jgi:hypothetical protein
VYDERIAVKLARSFLLAVIAGALAVAACTLNPQPLPPAAPDGSIRADAATNNATSEDAGSFGGPADDGAGGGGGMNGTDGGNPEGPPNDDGGTHGGDAGDLDAADGAD